MNAKENTAAFVLLLMEVKPKELQDNGRDKKQTSFTQNCN